MERTYLKIKKFNRDLNFIQRKINVREKECLKEAGFDITHREFEYIVIIHDYQGNKLKDALETLDVSKSTWSNQLKVLVNKKIVSLEIDKNDKRIKRPKLTAYGQRIYKIHKKVRELYLEEYASHLTNEEIEAMFSVFSKIKKVIKENNR